VVDTLQEAIQIASREPHSCVLVDMHLVLKTPASVKVKFEDITNGLPSAVFNINSSTGEIVLRLRGEAASQVTSLDQLVSLYGESKPRIIFPKKRETHSFNVLLDTDPEMKNPEKTVTINISSGGCFLFSVRDDISVGVNVWVRLIDTGLDSPIKGTVIWVRKWGGTQLIPGIGIKFADVLD
jgi:hypothetical protein